MPVSYSGPKKYDFIDELRGIAILGVIVSHLQYLKLGILESFSTSFVIALGKMGVPLFFIISAYTLCLSIESRKNTETHYYRNFYLRRFFRIYPLFLIINIFVFFFLSFISTNGNISFDFNTSLSNLIFHITFIYGFLPDYIGSMYLGEWSLFNEFIFYALFPIIFILIKKISLKKNLGLLLVTFSICYFSNILSYLYGFYDLYGTPLTHFFSFNIGIVIFLIKNLAIPEKNI